ncbi:MAG TPA: ATP-binding protein [Desulfotomaculum sp.]|nr:ATP-binding protein [Desulfotomaculum sp.]
MQKDDGCSSCADKKNGGCDGDKCPEKLGQNDNSLIGSVIAVMSGKGGVGKSSVTSLLASSFRKKGHSVGVLDADITGPSIPKMFGVKGPATMTENAIMPVVTSGGIKLMSLNLLTPVEDDPVIWRGPIIAGAVKQFWTDVAWGKLDYLFVDLPPGTGDVPLTVMQSLPLNGIIVVTSPQELATMIVSKAVKMARIMEAPIVGLIENMSGVVCPHCGEEFPLFGNSQGKETAQKFNIPFLGSFPLDPSLSKLCDQGRIEDYQSNFFAGILPEALIRPV